MCLWNVLFYRVDWCNEIIVYWFEVLKVDALFNEIGNIAEYDFPIDITSFLYQVIS